jgi:hypothetical protein
MDEKSIAALRRKQARRPMLGETLRESFDIFPPLPMICDSPLGIASSMEKARCRGLVKRAGRQIEAGAPLEISV